MNFSKACSTCKSVKFFSDFYKNKIRKDGLSGQCKKCVGKIQKQRYDRENENILEKKRQHYKDHLEKFQERAKINYQKNREKNLQYRRQYYKVNRENILEYLAKYRKENYGKIRKNNKIRYQKNRENVLEYMKKYGQTEQGKANSSNSRHKYRALKAGATVEKFTPQEVFDRDRYICQSCGIKTRPDYKNQYHPKYPNLDHIIPLSVGGDHSKKNTQCLCYKCNLEKGNRHANDQMLLIG